MFLGHFAVGLAAKKAAPKVSLGTFFVATQFIDLLWPVFLLLGIEAVRIDPGNTAFTPLDFYHYPFTHSFVGVLIWSVVFGLVYYAIRRRRNDALLLGGIVLSHWFLDLLTHRPDLPLAPGSDVHVGLGLWNSVAGTLVFELALFAVGIAIYLKATKPKDRIGTYGFWGLIGVLSVIYLVNVFGPPPPSESMIAIAGNATWLFVIWAYWVDRHRKTPGRG
jgi:membrane-bound metal-dependent hydrolase YbcI (DUF457 family)